MDFLVIWNGDLYEVPCPDPVTAALVLEAFLGAHPRLCGQGLALFTSGGTELEPHQQVLPGEEYVLRPAVVH